jgi:hypothetical protein
MPARAEDERMGDPTAPEVSPDVVLEIAEASEATGEQLG